MLLQQGETISDCLGPEFKKRDEPCAECGAVCYRVIVICGAAGHSRRWSLCGKHFIQALHEYPKDEYPKMDDRKAS